MAPSLVCLNVYHIISCQLQTMAVRRGMARVVPMPLLMTFTGPQLETLVVGCPELDLNFLVGGWTEEWDHLVTPATGLNRRCGRVTRFPAAHSASPLYPFSDG